MAVKALFFSAQTPYADMGDLIQIARSEATKILGQGKVKVLNILWCNYPLGYIAVVQKSGGKIESSSLKGEN